MIALDQAMAKLVLALIVAVAALSATVLRSSAQARCSTTLECAQQAVDAAARADAAVQGLRTRIEKLEAWQKTIGEGRILAMGIVKAGKLYTSSPGASFDQKTGLFSFSNPKALPFVPVISDSSESTYITSTHWIKSIIGADKFVVRLKAMDTSERTYEPTDFTAVVIGFEPPSKP